MSVNWLWTFCSRLFMTTDSRKQGRLNLQNILRISSISYVKFLARKSLLLFTYIGEKLIDSLIKCPECALGPGAHAAIVPLVGSDAVDPVCDDLMTACEVYCHDEGKLVLVQLRSTLVKSKIDNFIQDVLTWAKDVGIKQVVTLTSSNADERIDEQLTGTQLRYVAPTNDLFANLGWLPLEKRNRFPGQTADNRGQCENLFIPDGGFAKKLHLKAIEMDLNSTILLTFCSEGDNVKDAVDLVRYINQWMTMLPKNDVDQDAKLKFPISWQHLYGNRPPSAIY